MDRVRSSLRFRVLRRFVQGSGLWKGLLALALAVPQAGFALTKKKFDFVVGRTGDFKAAMAAASSAASSGKRFHIFFPDGEYDIGSLTGDSNQKTTFTAPNVSFIGQSPDKTVLFNKSVDEGIGITATLYFNNADNLYMQDMTIFNKAVYGNTAAYNTTGRHVAIQEQSDKVVYKNVKLKSTQDTYYTKGTRTYWEGGEIHGTTDFICGSGDVFFHKVLIWEMKSSAIVAPSSTDNTWGYVFKDCTIDGTVTNFTLGRSWNDAKAVFLNTTMNKLPSAAGWGDPMNSVPKVFAEYNSTTANGAAVDLSKRRTSYTKGTTTVTLNPVLTDAQAARYTVANVLGGTDNWQPQNATRQVAAPGVRLEGFVLRWNDDPDALCWMVFRNGKYLANVATNAFDFSMMSSISPRDTLTVRAANEMGGLGARSNAAVVGSSSTISGRTESGLSHRYDPASGTLHVAGGGGAMRVRLHAADGSLALSRDIQVESADRDVGIHLGRLEAGTYLLRCEQGESTRTGSIVVR
ncbi:MAG TPA: pectinesterase family protein [Fibrobacteria bacterium]|nr:pectinesterase family protein [Fibrobacteria bacterium]